VTPDMAAPESVHVRLVAARGLIGMGLLLFGADAAWCALARGAVHPDAYSIGMMALSAFGVVALCVGACMVVYHTQRQDSALIIGELAALSAETAAWRSQIGDGLKELTAKPPARRTPRQPRPSAAKTSKTPAERLAEDFSKYLSTGTDVDDVDR
jgi:hypothetical protein